MNKARIYNDCFLLKNHKKKMTHDVPSLWISMYVPGYSTSQTLHLSQVHNVYL